MFLPGEPCPPGDLLDGLGAGDLLDLAEAEPLFINYGEEQDLFGPSDEEEDIVCGGGAEELAAGVAEHVQAAVDAVAGATGLEDGEEEEGGDSAGAASSDAPPADPADPAPPAADPAPPAPWAGFSPPSPLGYITNLGKVVMRIQNNNGRRWVNCYCHPGCRLNLPQPPEGPCVEDLYAWMYAVTWVDSGMCQAARKALAVQHMDYAKLRWASRRR